MSVRVPTEKPLDIDVSSDNIKRQTAWYYRPGELPKPRAVLAQGDQTTTMLLPNEDLPSLWPVSRLPSHLRPRGVDAPDPVASGSAFWSQATIYDEGTIALTAGSEETTCVPGRREISGCCFCCCGSKGSRMQAASCYRAIGSSWQSCVQRLHRPRRCWG